MFPRVIRTEPLNSSKWYAPLRSYHWVANAAWGPYMKSGPIARTKVGAWVGAIAAVVWYAVRQETR